jgi:hypothetical protein
VPAVGFSEHFLNVPIRHITGVGLVKALPDRLLHELRELVFGDKNVRALRLVVFNFDSASSSVTKRLALFFCEFGDHRGILPHRQRAARAKFVSA